MHELACTRRGRFGITPRCVVAHAHIVSRIGISSSPAAVNAYSTFTGTPPSSVRCTMPSISNWRASSITWTSFSPAAFFDLGERTGNFRLGTDDLITGSDGQSRISMEDYAIATLDELEHPQHLKARFTIGY